MVRKIIFYLISLLIIIADQVTKIFLTTTTNTGAAFGLFKDNVFLITVISLIITGAIIYYLIKSNVFVVSLGLSFLLGGAISNLIDRVFLGYVRDFINFLFIPTFNIADMFNVIGALLLVYYLVREK
ncbi:signal peptidase II [Candidatus Woesearchaeota archaeon]|nr:signal peptidase II [Candidatus Woesearchaeota archaeon]